jgi:hypothetical protein
VSSLFPGIAGLVLIFVGIPMKRDAATGFGGLLLLTGLIGLACAALPASRRGLRRTVKHPEQATVMNGTVASDTARIAIGHRRRFCYFIRRAWGDLVMNVSSA